MSEQKQEFQKNSRPNVSLSEFPELSTLKKEQKRLLKRAKRFRLVRHSAWILSIAAAVAVLVVCLWTPVIRIYGKSMTPALVDGDIVLSIKGEKFETGDIVVFDFNNRKLVKRIIAGPGDWVDMDDDGTVYVNRQKLDEPYLIEKDAGQTDIEYPFQVTENNWFVMGDHRSVSADSRTKAIGTIPTEQIVGKIVFRFWPFEDICSF